jgi:hypothetical protein
MINSVIGSTPGHIYVHVDTTYIFKTPQRPRYVDAVWFGVVSYPGRSWGCSVLLADSGAVYRALPPMALAFSAEPCDITAAEASTWDCYSTDFSIHAYEYLSDLRCLARAGAQELSGRYLFTAAPYGDGWSDEPAEQKELHFIQLDIDRLTIQPGDRVVFEERSFTGATPLAFPRGIKRQTEIYRCE